MNNSITPYPNETNGLGGLVDANAYHDKWKGARTVYWDAKGLKLDRLRLLTDSYFPAWDVSYCHGLLNGEPVNVQLPFSQIPKRGFNAFIIKAAKQDGVYAKGLGLWESISKLW